MEIVQQLVEYGTLHEQSQRNVRQGRWKAENTIWRIFPVGFAFFLKTTFQPFQIGNLPTLLTFEAAQNNYMDVTLN